jgi:hypothetical protein
MFRNAFRLIPGFTLWLFLLSSGCGTSSPTASDQPREVRSESVPHSRYGDDVGRFIAGLPGTAGSPFIKLEATPAWKEHRRRLDAAWEKAKTPLMSGIVEFGKRELSNATLHSTLVFYPFSGPDALTMVLEFPHSPGYVMVGLEPAGTLPGLGNIEKKDLPAYLSEMRNTVASELGRSFFVTRQMDRQFRGQVTDGLALPILHLLVRTNNTVLGLRYVRLDEQGELVSRASDYKAPGKIGNKGIEIEFRADADQSIHQLYYFSVNLSDERLKENQPFLSYVARLKGAVTLLKATSYMTHHPDFSLIRSQILANSAAILQDDSGIPFRYFKPDVWNVVLYGDYNRPYGSFRWLEQPDLRKAYESGGVKPLSLHLGYGYSRIASNLLLARLANPVPTASR